MALNPSTNGTMAGRITAASSSYPYGSAKDETTSGAGDGTPYFKARADDIFGMQQALLTLAGITPSGSADTVLSSQYVQAITIIARNYAFTSGTLMLFQQTAAPLGWTKQTTHNDKALRVVSGAASSGGSTVFSSVMASRAPTGNVSVAGHTLTLAETPIHDHGGSTAGVGDHTHGMLLGQLDTPHVLNGPIVNSDNLNDGGTGPTQPAGAHAHGISSAGSGDPHAHLATFGGFGMDFNIQYVDLIIARKD